MTVASAGSFIDGAALVSRYAIAFVFLVSAVPKFFDPRGFERAVANYELLPQRLVAYTARWLPPLELVCAAGLFVGVAVTPFALLASLMLLTFSTAVGLNLRRGRKIDCGCSGSVAPKKLSWPLVMGDLALALIAAISAVVNPHVLVLFDFAGDSHPSFLGSRDGLALVALAGAVVIAELIVSACIELRLATRSFEARRHEEVST